MGTKLEELRNGCFARAMDDEPMFVLLARDPASPEMVEQWAQQREDEIKAGKRPANDMAQVEEARTCAKRMRSWRVIRDGAWREGLFAARNEQTSPYIASLASKLMKHEDPEVRAVAASALTQAPDWIENGS